jgi:hypothetical protein
VTARYRVEVSKTAGKQIAALDRTAQNRLIGCGKHQSIANHRKHNQDAA